MALRIGLPLIGYALGAGLNGWRSEPGAVYAVAGAAGAAALDAAFLAWDRWQGPERSGRAILALGGSF
jgi:hypothetical protein